MSSLISKPGITNASTLAIPKDWSAAWFKSLVSNLLQGGDVRNAIAGPGITITGNISSPYATISAGGAGAPFSAPFIVKTTPGGITVFEVFNSLTGPTVEAYGPQAGGLVDMTPDGGTFQGTLTGMTGVVTGTFTWRRSGNFACIAISSLVGTSAAGAAGNAMSLTGVPTFLNPAIRQFIPCNVEDNGANVYGSADVGSSAGTINFQRGVVSGTALQQSATGFTSGGSKGLNVWSVEFQLA